MRNNTTGTESVYHNGINLGSLIIISSHNEVARGYKVCPVRKYVLTDVRTYVHLLSSL